MPTPHWVSAGPRSDLAARGRLLIKHDGRQIAVFESDTGLFACANRCPHEGYPLIEGSLADGCILTCNWHNWKFDLRDGSTVIGSDAVTTFPVEDRSGEVFVDVSGPPPEARRARALAGLRDAYGDDERDRIAREIARYEAADGDPLDLVRDAVAFAHERFEFGTTHAIAAAPDWLALAESCARTPGERLAAITEVIGHLNWDSLREPVYLYPTGETAFDADALVGAIEAEDEAAACAHIRGALAAGTDLDAVFHALARAALAHYADFGHSAIYTLKTEQLLRRLGPSAAEPLLSALVRSLVVATREDLIPEFKAYAPARAAWDGAGRATVSVDAFAGRGVSQAVQLCVDASADTPALYHALLGTAARQWLTFDLTMQDRTDNPVSRNVNWLDFTHAVTFANAARHLCARDPSLWPDALLQMACFTGRNAGFVDPDDDGAAWRIADDSTFLETAMQGLFDHGDPEFIVSAHRAKTLTAIADETAAAPNAPWRADLTAAWNRLASSPFKRRHALRLANQALDIVARE
jgi:nitrite reductase/ring-hydroxylating ferredoxin subunit